MIDERQEKFINWWKENVEVYKVYRFEWMCKESNGAFHVYTCLNHLIAMTTSGEAFWFTDTGNVVHAFGEYMAQDCKFTYYEVNE